MQPKILPRPLVTTLELVSCPECQAAAKVEWRETVESTGTPVELVKIMCLNRHWFLMPAEGLQAL